MKLTEKQKAFCDYYIESLNATESYKRAYECKNDSTARTNSSRMLTNANIKNYIDEKLKEIEDLDRYIDNISQALCDEMFQERVKDIKEELNSATKAIESILSKLGL